MQILKPIIDKLIENLYEVISEIDLYNIYFQKWLNNSQNLQNFTYKFNDENTNESSDKIQFVLESILATAMRLSVIDCEDISKLDIMKNISFGIENVSKIIFESDFYSWINNLKNPEIIEDLHKLSDEIRKINNPTFNDIYEYYFNKGGRKSKGQFYTELDLAKFIIDCTNQEINNLNHEIYALDPCCGAGSFIIALLNYYQNKNDGLLSNITIVGIDISYFACLMSRISYYKWYNNNLNVKKLDFIPVYWMDYLFDFGEFEKLNSINFEKKIIGIESMLEDEGFAFLRKICNKGFDLIVGNPPYIRIQKITEILRKQLKRRFIAATGRFDIYVLFIEKSLELLSKNGILSFICSNKFMTTNYGIGIRKVIINESSIIKIVDFTDTNFFDAMVLPSIIVLSKNRFSKEKFHYTSLSLTKNKVNTAINRNELWDIILKTEELDKEIRVLQNQNNNRRLQKNMYILSFFVKQPKNNKSWHFLSLSNDNLSKKIEVKSTDILGNIAKINVGIKTTCDKVFIFDKIPFNDKKSLTLIHPLLVAVNIKKWKIQIEKPKYILYPYEWKNKKIIPILLNEYTEIKTYFEKNKEILMNRNYIRESKTRKWFEIWVPLKPDIFEDYLKIVTPDISQNNRFAIDFEGNYCKGSCYIIKLNEKNKDFYFYIVSYLNSKICEFYHKAKLSTSIYSKRFRYMYNQLTKYPILDPRKSDRERYSEIITLTKNYLENEKKFDSKSFIFKINKIFYEIYNLTEKDIRILENFLDK